MRRRTNRRVPLIRLILVSLLAGVLFGAGFYAFYKRSQAEGLTMADSFNQMKAWVILHKQQLLQSGSIEKRELDDQLPAEEVKFEFYDTLANAEVTINTDKKEEASPIVSAKINPPAKKNWHAIASADDIEKEFFAQIKSSKK